MTKEKTPIRGEIYWVDFNPVVGSELRKVRPAVIVSPDSHNRYLQTVVVIPLTTKSHNYPGRIPLTVQSKKCFAAVDQIRCVSKMRLRGQIMTLRPATLQRLLAVVGEFFGE
jgi:mRNA interferase MazF